MKWICARCMSINPENSYTCHGCGYPIEHSEKERTNDSSDNAYGGGPMWNWFGLSYSSYLVLPRSLMCGMPRAWQLKMVELLNEMRETFDVGQIEDNYHVALRDGRGRFKKDELANYRHPPELPYSKG